MILHGKAACEALEKDQGIELNEVERRVVMLEGYATEPYKDTKGILTNGVGQTGEWINRPFRDAFLHHVERVKARFPDFRLYPSYLKAELVQAEYRGDLGLSRTTCMHIKNGEWRLAANEFLDNNEYRALATPESIKKRMAALHYALMLKDCQS